MTKLAVSVGWRAVRAWCLDRLLWLVWFVLPSAAVVACLWALLALAGCAAQPDLSSFSDEALAVELAERGWRGSVERKP